MTITAAAINWTRTSQPGAFPARYTGRRGLWQWQITDRRRTGATLTAWRDGVKVLDAFRAPTLRDAKDHARGMLSAAESMAWFRHRGTRTYETSYGSLVFRAKAVDQSFQVILTENGTSRPGPLTSSLAEAKKAVARLVDRRYPPKTWEAVPAPSRVPERPGYCAECEHCNT